eukprot:8671056-Pyramimonas_sp.AAC.1
MTALGSACLLEVCRPPGGPAKARRPWQRGSRRASFAQGHRAARALGDLIRAAGVEKMARALRYKSALRSRRPGIRGR